VVETGRAADLTGRLVVVNDTLRALADFARWYRHQREALVIGVTGSVGKTTTREMIYTVLSARHTGTCSRGNMNNEIGLPLSLLELAADDEFGVFEMGATKKGDIRELCEIAFPEVGVVTAIGPAHLHTFGSLQKIYEGKFELLESLPPHGFAVVGGDDEKMRQMAERAVCPVIFVGEKPGNKVRAVDVEFEPGRLRFTVDRKRYEVPAPARHYLVSALCALVVAREVGMDANAISAGFQKFTPQPGRCRVEQVNGWTIIDDTYNANPISMQAACDCLADWPTEHNRLMIVGDMLELGNEATRRHLELGERIAASGINHLLTFGEHAREVVQGAVRAGMSPHRLAEFHDFDSLLAVLDCWLESGDVLLVKGSRGMKMERVIAWLQTRAGHASEPSRRDPPARAVA
jgi:UDP-N-acetylmuramoyl-tripeptide--D-alanyl-D-alanine ligase